MAFREVSVNEIREVLRVWLGVAGLPAPGYRTIAAHCGVDRKTVRRYVEAAQAAGLRRGLPRVFRTADFVSIYAASCEFRYSARTSCGVR